MFLISVFIRKDVYGAGPSQILIVLPLPVVKVKMFFFFFFIFMITHCFQPTCQPDYQLYNHLNMDLLEHNTKKQIKKYQTIIKTLIQHMAPTPIKKFLSSYVARIFFLVSQSSDFLQRFCAANTSITFNE